MKLHGKGAVQYAKDRRFNFCSLINELRAFHKLTLLNPDTPYYSLLVRHLRDGIKRATVDLTKGALKQCSCDTFMANYALYAVSPCLCRRIFLRYYY